jgi:uncharacterized UBP type Zn finger protein
MFKKLIAKGHAEFSGGKQQDALEFWHYFLSQVQQKEHVNRVDPTDTFNFQQQVSQPYTLTTYYTVTVSHGCGVKKRVLLIAAKVELND